ncbi:hypothetical protein AYI68_g3012 [Smittium mucronatum]|uniref:Uncharacterized protein n=1 Tax=Smittium mucronatum TaxID=133383 RepID=A0A1R0H134_9FUNG|nr:hypothetical protein AYI68_g3012 [Smittium mucronatum]
MVLEEKRKGLFVAQSLLDHRRPTTTVLKLRHLCLNDFTFVVLKASAFVTITADTLFTAQKPEYQSIGP